MSKIINDNKDDYFLLLKPKSKIKKPLTFTINFHASIAQRVLRSKHEGE